MPETAARSVVVERMMPHPPEKVWRALTEAPLLERWLMRNDFRPEVGHAFRFRAEPMPPKWNGLVDCEVLAVEPSRLLSYRWSSSGDDPSDGLDTVVTWTLEPTEGGTLLRMEQSGFRPSPEHDQFYQGARYGWQNMVGALEGVVATLD
jgi:uncharacterized protein YndB with AHSA1/START domain